MMKQKLIIGIGRIGCDIADVFARTTPADTAIHTMAIDTDQRTIETVTNAFAVSLAFPCKICDVLDQFDTELLKPWFPCDRDNEAVEYFETMSLMEGSNQWRMKALLSFYYFLSSERYSRPFFTKLNDIISLFGDTDEEKLLDIYVSASLAGGTGSGLFLPVVLYLKRYFAKAGIKVSCTTALLALPDIVEDKLTQEQKIKAHANAYASLREINAVNLISDGDSSISFKLGHPDDTLFGLLFDSDSPEARLPENRPINEVYLFRRIPGFRSIGLHTGFIKDALVSLISEDRPPYTKTSDAVYGGISIAKTIFPDNGIVDYISHKKLLDIENNEWMRLYTEASNEYKRLKASSTDNAECIAEAVSYAVDKLRPDNDSSLAAILGREYSDTDTAPKDLFCEDYLNRIIEFIISEFENDGSRNLESVISDHRDITDSVTDDKKKEKALYKSHIDRKELVDLMTDCCSDIYTYFKDGVCLIENTDGISAALANESSPLSIIKNVIKDSGSTPHPAYSLARLCALYRRIDLSLERFRREKLPVVCKDAPDALPAWTMDIHKDISADCSYGRLDSNRLRLLFEGETSHVGKKFIDKNLFIYDITSSYKRIRAFFTNHRLEAVLKIVGNFVEAYFEFFTALKDCTRELYDLTDVALMNFTSGNGMTYYVGASEEEKKIAYRKYVSFLKDLDTDPFESIFDEAIGKVVIGAICNGCSDRDSFTPLIMAKNTELVDVIRNHCNNDGFCKANFDQNIIQVLLEQSEETGGIKSEFAMCKAFCAGQMPIRYVLPEIRDSYKISRLIKSDVRVTIPVTVNSYLTGLANSFGGADPVRIIEKLLFDAGEYYGEVAFDDSLPEKELRVVRKVTGLKLSLIEALNESTNDGIYYKAYKKAFVMQYEQNTALWNPHIICGLTDDVLPKICDDINSVIN